MTPEASLITLPEGYGRPGRTVDWSQVRARLTEAVQYWLATTRPDGRPHVVPVDGLWHDDVWYFGGSPQTVHQQNLREQPEIVMHLADPVAAVIVEGRAEWVQLPEDLGERLAAASKAKYGYAPPGAYSHGVWVLRPRRVLAWTSLPEDATRFTFGGER